MVFTGRPSLFRVSLSLVRKESIVLTRGWYLGRLKEDSGWETDHWVTVEGAD